MINEKEHYGITPMTFEEEMKLWEEHPSEARTRNNKRIMIQCLEGMSMYINSCIEYVKHIPEENDEKHADKVAELANLFDNAYKDLYLGFDRIVYIP